MNIAYFRKSERPLAEVADVFKKGLVARGFSVIGETKLGADGGTLIHFIDEKKFGKIVGEDPMLIGLVPVAALVREKDGKATIGVGNPQILMGTPKARELEDTVGELDEALRALVNEAAGAGDPKVEKVKLYSTATCPYCKMEKDYLEKNKVPFELVMVDADRKAAEEMMQKSGQMGVPVTEVTFDDGDYEMIVGFDKGRLKQLLNIKA